MKDNYLRLLLLLTPVWLRRGLYTVICRSLAAATASVYEQLTSYKENTEYRVKYNGQVFSLRNAVNDIADYASRRCTIGYPPNSNGNIITQREAGDTLIAKAVPDVIITTRSYTGSTSIDFTVCLPYGLSITDGEISECVNKYKLTSKRYIILRDGENSK